MAANSWRTRTLAVLAVLLAAGWLVVRVAASPPSPNQIRAWTAEILSSGGYQVNPPLGWRIERWLLELLQRILGSLALASHSGPLAGLPQWASWLVVGACVVALALIITHLLLTLRGLMVEPRRRRDRERLVAERPRTPQQALREAEQAAAAGQFALALRRLYEAAVLILDRRGLLPYDPTRTNWENLRAVAGQSPDTARVMTPLTRTVDGCVYGGIAATLEDWQRSRALVRQLERGASSSD